MSQKTNKNRTEGQNIKVNLSIPLAIHLLIFTYCF